MSFESQRDSQENITGKQNEQRQRIPEITNEQRDRIGKLYPELKRGSEKFLSDLYDLGRDEPKFFQRLKEKHPSLFDNCSRLREVYSMLASPDLTNADFSQFTQEHDWLVDHINRTMEKIRVEEEERSKAEICKAAEGQLEFDETQLTPEEKQQLREAATLLKELLFPPSDMENFILEVTGEKELRGLQKIALAPVAGIETALKAIIESTDPQVWVDIVSNLGRIISQPEELLKIWNIVKFTFDQLETTEKISEIVSALTSIILLFGGRKQLFRFLDKNKTFNQLPAIKQKTMKLALRLVAPGAQHIVHASTRLKRIHKLSPSSFYLQGGGIGPRPPLI